jgi:hypothetical protein
VVAVATNANKIRSVRTIATWINGNFKTYGILTVKNAHPMVLKAGM